MSGCFTFSVAYLSQDAHLKRQAGGGYRAASAHDHQDTHRRAKGCLGMALWSYNHLK